MTGRVAFQNSSGNKELKIQTGNVIWVKGKTCANMLVGLLMLFICLWASRSVAQVEGFSSDVIVGAERTKSYLEYLKGKQVAIVANQTSVIGKTHLVDTLVALGINITKVFAPEHGFRGTADAGEHVKDATDKRTGLPVISLYGKNKKPGVAMLADVDVIVFDIQDVGARFYTYISTLHYIMEAAAEDEKQVLVLDRPNPNGHYVDGPILEKGFKSFVGMHPVPVVHGMTVGEYAQMINGELWLRDKVVCELKVIACENYDHNTFYKLPIKPSPNLPNMASIYLYPSLCFFEGTIVSVGRGTQQPFQVIGHPGFSKKEFGFKPESIPGASKYPPYEGEQCYGYDLSSFGETHMRDQRKLYLHWLLGMFEDAKDKGKFFNNFFEKLAGNSELKKQIESGMPLDEIQATWEVGLVRFKKIRKKYLLYPDFE